MTNRRFRRTKFIPSTGCGTLQLEKKAVKHSVGFSLTIKGKGVILMGRSEMDRDEWVSKIRECLDKMKTRYGHATQLSGKMACP
jgi:hypothetical protein